MVGRNKNVPSFTSGGLTPFFGTVDDGFLLPVFTPDGLWGSATPSQVGIGAGVAVTPTRATAQATKFTRGVVAVQTAGYASAGDGGGALYRRVATQPSNEGKFRSADGAWWEIANTTIDPRMFGAVGNGTADDTTSFVNAVAFATSKVKADPAGADRVSTIEISLSPGTFLLTRAGALLPSTFTTKARGYRLLGSGPGLTQIIFRPPNGTDALLNNVSAFLQCEVRDITFISQTAGATFLNSINNNPPGAVQRWSFDRCEWNGSWGYCLYLTGNNNNSEWNFSDCGVSGTMGNFVYVPVATGSDQFLNFWIKNFKFWPSSVYPATNNMFWMGQGGAIEISDSDFSGYQSGQLFTLKGASHSYGVCHFHCRGCRFELKTEYASVMLSEWPQGAVSFDGCDFGSATNIYPSATTAFEFTDVNSSGSALSFRACTLIGTIKFNHGSNDFEIKKSTLFESCEFPQQYDVFAAFNMAASTNDVGHRSVSLVGCLGKSTRLFAQLAWAPSTAYTVDTLRRNGQSVYQCTTAGTSAASGFGPSGKGSAIADGTVVWAYLCNNSRDYVNDGSVKGYTVSRPTEMSRKTAMFGDSLPTFGGVREIILPPNAVIVSARIQSPVGAVTSGAAADYKIQSCEDTPTVLVSGSASPASAGFDYNVAAAAFRTGTTMKTRTMQLIAGAGVDQANFVGVAFLEYLS